MPPTALHTRQTRMLPALAADVSNAQNANVPIGAATSKPSDLPAGWHQRYTSTGKPYFVNRRMRCGTWCDPRQDRQSIRRPDHNASDSNANATSSSTSASPTSSIDAALPDSERASLGWEQSHTPEGRAYFLNHNTRMTTWDDPRQQKHTHANDSIPNSDGASSKAQPMSHMHTLSTQLPTLVPPLSIGKLYTGSYKNKAVTWGEPQGPSSLNFKGFSKAHSQKVNAKSSFGAPTRSQSNGVSESQTFEQKTRRGEQANAGMETKAVMSGEGAPYEQSCVELSNEVSDDEEYVKVEDDTEEGGWEMI